MGVLWVRGTHTALVVVVMVVAVRITEMPATVVTVGRQCGVVGSILGISCHGSRDWGSVTILHRIHGRRRGPFSTNDPHTAVDTSSILPLLQFPEAGRLVLLVLGSPMTTAPRWSLKATIRRKRKSIWPSRV